MSASVEYRLLGPLEVINGSGPLAARGQKKRALLARLLLEAGRTVSVDALVDSLWGEDVPPTAVKMIHIYVSQLRKELPGGTLQTRPPGYQLVVGPDAVDLLRFSKLCAQARAALADGDPAEAAEHLRTALALWRGPALAEFSEPFAATEGAHLEELRLLALEDRIDADLTLGRHADVVGELQALVAAHPLRERPRSRLMLALYRAGRHAEALAAYHDLHGALRDQLGIEPSAALRELQVRILNQDRELDVPEREGAAPPTGAERIVGRAAELERLDAALTAAFDGHGTTALISGPAGIGKTRVAAELARRARGRGATVLTGRCIDVVGAAVPYLPLIEALRPLRETSALDALPELARLLPGAGALPPAAAYRNAGETQLRLFSSVLTVLDRLAADAPVVLVLEDLQWADGSTLDLVAFLARAIQGGRVLLLATARQQAVQPDEGLHRLVAGLRSAGAATVVELGPLSRGELETLVERSAGGPVPGELADAVCARAEGNPFFAQELLAAALRGDEALPVQLRDVLLADFGRLSAEARAVVRVAAAAGRPVTRELLASAMGIAAGAIAGALREAVEHGLLVPDGTLGTYGFRHALIAEAAYGTLLPGELEEVHERLAVALAREPAGATAGEVAEHWIVARRAGEALAASLEAARSAQAVSGLAEALRHLERVLELWEQVPGAEQMTGVAMPALLGWVAALADRPAPARLAVSEARELFPLAVVLESLAIRQSPPFGPGELDQLRWANERLRRARNDPFAASAADDDFHAALIAACGDEPLRAALRPVKRALLRYEHFYMADPDRIDRSAEQHDGIVAAVERGDHAEAAQRLRDNLTGGLGILTPALER
ncbi:MAG TPA: BTAD domain-containing putative transcriptional regulator [Solirubrobacteraceae bacterium]|nr:BTAD domain-containing putative transcriptional regulator [Solirubrobacteraceae bacterium]